MVVGPVKLYDCRFQPQPDLQFEPTTPLGGRFLQVLGFSSLMLKATVQLQRSAYAYAASRT